MEFGGERDVSVGEAVLFGELSWTSVGGGELTLIPWYGVNLL